MIAVESRRNAPAPVSGSSTRRPLSRAACAAFRCFRLAIQLHPAPRRTRVCWPGFGQDLTVVGDGDSVLVPYSPHLPWRHPPAQPKRVRRDDWRAVLVTMHDDRSQTRDWACLSRRTRLKLRQCARCQRRWIVPVGLQLTTAGKSPLGGPQRERVDSGPWTGFPSGLARGTDMSEDGIRSSAIWRLILAEAGRSGPLRWSARGSSGPRNDRGDPVGDVSSAAVGRSAASFLRPRPFGVPVTTFRLAVAGGGKSVASGNRH